MRLANKGGIVIWAVLMVLSPMCAGQGLRVLPDEVGGGALKGPTDQMMKRWLAGQVATAGEAWRARYEKLKTADEIADYQKRQKAFFIEAIGGLPKRTPLNARVVGEVKREGFTVRKVIFESQPRHFVTNLLFVPDAKKFPGKRPGVLLVCGHADEGKANEKYQKEAALLALNGIACLMMDPIDQGERYQMIDAEGKAVPRGSTTNHMMLGVGSILLGRNTARFEIWDGMRAIDYLQSLDFIDGAKIGCLGNSGGGTQTAYLMALDERVAVASPSCYITRMDVLIDQIGPQDAEQNIFGQLGFGMWHSDYLLMRAPKPTLLCVATHDYFNIEGAWSVYRDAKRMFGRMGYAERVDLVEHDETHGYNQPLREAAARWMVRWLSGEDRVIFEPEIEVLSIEEAQCTPRGQVMLMKGARSVYDLNRDEENRWKRVRARLWSEGDAQAYRQRVREVAGIRALKDLPAVVVDKIGEVGMDGATVEKVVMRVEDGIFLPMVVVKPTGETKSKEAVLWLPGDGIASINKDVLRVHLNKGRTVVIAELRGMGETMTKEKAKWGGLFGQDHREAFTAYLLGRPYVGMRAEDAMVLARYVSAEYGDGAGVHLIATGKATAAGVHAGALEPGLFSWVRLEGMLGAWSRIVEHGDSKDQVADAVHGALRVYDLDYLAHLVGDKLEIVGLSDRFGELVGSK